MLRQRTLSFIAACVAVVSACSGSPARTVPTEPQTPPNEVFNAVVVGDGASTSFVGRTAFRDSWPQVFFRTALPRTATFFNLSTRFSTTGEAIERQVPQLPALKPKVVAIWLGIDDIGEGVSPQQYALDLQAVVLDAHSAGATIVLVANIPDEVTNAAQFNAAASLRVTSSDAVLVDLRPLTITFDASADGRRYQPDTSSLASIANAFATSYRSALASISTG